MVPYLFKYLFYFIKPRGGFLEGRGLIVKTKVRQWNLFEGRGVNRGLTVYDLDFTEERNLDSRPLGKCFNNFIQVLCHPFLKILM